MNQMDIEQVAEKIGRELTKKGNLVLGDHDAGRWGPPGSRITEKLVKYFLMQSGDYRVYVADKAGSNQGYCEWHHKEEATLDGTTLEDVVAQAREYIETLEDQTEMRRAWLIATSEARATMRKIEKQIVAP